MIEIGKKVVKSTLGVVNMFFGIIGALILLILFVLCPPLFVIVVMVGVIYVIKSNKN